MNINNTIRNTLKAAGAMSVEELADANSWDVEQRNHASRNIYSMRKTGELRVVVGSGNKRYELVPGYVVKPAHRPRKVPASHPRKLLRTDVDKPPPPPPPRPSNRNAPQPKADQPDLHTRAGLLAHAAQIVAKDRNATHGEPEESFTRVAALWSAYLGAPIAPHDVAAMMAALKIARIRENPEHADNWVDLAGYAACGAEVSNT